MRNIVQASIALVIALGMIGGCVDNPLRTAQTTEQKAYAVYGTFVVAEEQAAKLVVNPQLPPAAAKALSQADGKAKPIVDNLLAAVKEYDAVSTQLAAGATTSDKLAVAAANLNQWLLQAAPLVDGLVAAVKGASQ